VREQGQQGQLQRRRGPGQRQAQPFRPVRLQRVP
jgi:hypothetical protein